jgi:hypothetical protein
MQVCGALEAFSEALVEMAIEREDERVETV